MWELDLDRAWPLRDVVHLFEAVPQKWAGLQRTEDFRMLPVGRSADMTVDRLE
jgi:hypothetical protein